MFTPLAPKLLRLDFSAAAEVGDEIRPRSPAGNVDDVSLAQLVKPTGDTPMVYIGKPKENHRKMMV